MKDHFLGKSLIVMGAGVLYSWGFPSPISTVIFFAPMLSVMMLFLVFYRPLEKELRWSEKGVLLALFNLSATWSGVSWVPEVLHDSLGISFPSYYLLSLLICFLFIPQIWVYFLIVPVGQKFLQQKAIKENQHGLFYATLFVLVEYFTPQFIPSHVGHAWIELAPYLFFAPWMGVPFYSWISVWISFEGMTYIKSRGRKKNILSYILIAILLIINFMGNLTSELHDHHPQKINLRLVQPNMTGQDEKKFSTRKEFHQNLFSQFKKLTSQPSARPLDLIIWPEYAYPFYLDVFNGREQSEQEEEFPLKSLNFQGAHLMLGGYYINKKSNEKSEFFNSYFHFNQQMKLQTMYHKQLLFPFVEFDPWPFFQLIKLQNNYSRGDQFTLFQLKEKDIYFSSFICFEGIHSSFVRKLLNSFSVQKYRPQFLINPSNDGSFHRSLAVNQHYYLTRWRAIEFQIPIIFITNTGLTSILRTDGVEGEKLALLTANVLDKELTIKTYQQATLYQRWGLGALLVLIIFLELIFLAFNLFLSASKKGQLTS